MKEMKFRVYSPEHSKAIQERLFELGAKWFSYGKTPSLLDKRFLFVSYNGTIGWSNDEDKFSESLEKETTLDDLYRIIVHTRVVLNDDYIAKISNDGKSVEVGCQTFSFDKIKELYKACKEQQK